MDQEKKIRIKDDPGILTSFNRPISSQCKIVGNINISSNEHHITNRSDPLDDNLIELFGGHTVGSNISSNIDVMSKEHVVDHPENEDICPPSMDFLLRFLSGVIGNEQTENESRHSGENRESHIFPPSPLVPINEQKDNYNEPNLYPRNVSFPGLNPKLNSNILDISLPHQYTSVENIDSGNSPRLPNSYNYNSNINLDPTAPQCIQQDARAHSPNQVDSLMHAMHVVTNDLQKMQDQLDSATLASGSLVSPLESHRSSMPISTHTNNFMLNLNPSSNAPLANIQCNSKISAKKKFSKSLFLPKIAGSRQTRGFSAVAPSNLYSNISMPDKPIENKGFPPKPTPLSLMTTSLNSTCTPDTIPATITAQSASHIANPGFTSCSNCHAVHTSLWRRGGNGERVCNACGLYRKVYMKERPISMATKVLTRRRRNNR